MSLNERMNKRLAERPDQHTLAWWRDQFEEVSKGYRGLTHACNLLIAETEDQTLLVRRLEEYIEKQAKRLAEAEAAIGKLQAEFTESLGKVREAFAELKKRVK